MRERWVDSGDGILTINTPRLYIRLCSRARKNYRIIYSNWQLSVGVKGEYGYAVRFYYDFGGTLNDALERSEVIMRELFDAIQEVML